MASSILHSNSGVPWRAVRLLGFAFVAGGLGAAYTLFLNPEIEFFVRANQVKQQWVQKLDREQKSKIVILGGSSCLSAIDGERMGQKHGLPVANLGLGAGMGAKVLTRYALGTLRTGDTLLVVLEQNLLAGSLSLEPLGVQFSFASGNSALLRDPDSIDWPRRLLELRPGSYHAFTLLGKIAAGQPLYRYRPEEIQASGWQRIEARRDLKSSHPHGAGLSSEGGQLLDSIRQYCSARGVRVAYSLPWNYVAPEKIPAFQRANLEFIRQVSEHLAVLKEPRLGAYPLREHFADTDLHLNEAGAIIRTDELAPLLKSWEMWSAAELEESLRRTLN